MRQWRFFSGVLAGPLTIIAGAQAIPAAQAPAAVMRGFAGKFPAVKAAEWKIKSAENYEAEFTES